MENLQHTIDVIYGARRSIVDRLHSAIIGTHCVRREHLNGQGIVLFYIHIYNKTERNNTRQNFQTVKLSKLKIASGMPIHDSLIWQISKLHIFLGNPLMLYIYTIVYCSLILLEDFPIYLSRRLVIPWI